MPQKILSYLVLFNSTPLQILYPWVLQFPGKERLVWVGAIFSGWKSPIYWCFLPKKRVGLYSQMGLEKSFLVLQEGSCFDFVTSSYTKVKKKVLYSTFNFLGTECNFCWHYFLVNRCLYELAFASSNGQIDSRTFCGLCLVLVTFGNFFRIFCFWKGLILLC